MTDRDCPHGHQKGKCDTCDLIIAEKRIAALEEAVKSRDAAITALIDDDTKDNRIASLEAALIRIRDCDWVITLPDRMDAVRDIARDALND